MTNSLQLKPVYGVNYDKGYIGFSYNDETISKGITYFTRRDRKQQIKVSHVFLVTEENSCIEADAFTGKVEEAYLTKYFYQTGYQVFFKKPKDLNSEIADLLISVLKKEVGKPYDYKLILSHALSDSLLYSFLSLFHIKKLFLNATSSWMCSELVSYGLNSIDKYKGIGVLKNPSFSITPQSLFEDTEIFEKWKEELPNKFEDLVYKY